jgi:hypothetical protein
MLYTCYHMLRHYPRFFIILTYTRKDAARYQPTRGTYIIKKLLHVLINEIINFMQNDILQVEIE